MKNFFKMTVLAFVLVSMAGTINAQEWTADQTAVWKVVQDTWKGWKNGDAGAAFGSVHEKYQGWSDDGPIPMGKQSMVEWYNTMKDGMTMNYYNIEPARIVVLKEAAVVQYFYYMNVTWKMGDQSGAEIMKGKVAEFYVKEGGKWMLLGDMMTHEGKEDDDD